MLLFEATIFTISLIVAYLLRFDFELPPVNRGQIVQVLPFLVPLKLGLFFSFGLYRGMWRYSTLRDAWKIGYASFFSMLLLMSVVVFLGIREFPRTVYVIDMALTFILTGAVRIGIRTYYHAKSCSKGFCSLSSLSPVFSSNKNSKRILIIGAGSYGQKIAQEIFENPQLQYEVFGFLDDDPKKLGRTVLGLPVLGHVESLPVLCRKAEIQEVFVAVPSASGPQMRRILEICKDAKVSHKSLPGIGEIIEGKATVKALRDINYEDLLRRAPVVLDMGEIRNYIAGKTVLITGGGGSIASELCRQIIRFEPGTLIILDSCEKNLFEINIALRDEFKYAGHKCILASVQDQKLMEHTFSTFRPHVVFHAAAYKHVPMLERNPWEAVFNNVYGTQVTMELALRYGVERFVLVSTDKAVKPTNVMGTTKRLTEFIMQSFPQEVTRFMAVRFGNVVGSSGSVIPLFRKQIMMGGPVTVTHPDMTRYFMTIPEASQLILQAGSIGNGGEIFVLEMGTPVKIADMARDLIRLSGKEPDVDIPIKFSGIRPGEKLYEELITVGEDAIATRHQKIMMLKTNGRSAFNGQGSRENFSCWLNQHLQELYRVSKYHDACGIKRKLKEIVREYVPQDTECVFPPEEQQLQQEKPEAAESGTTILVSHRGVHS
ncbi:MAG: polysaccharide biosynthesis protein [Desulfobacteraceae bacterium]|nr:polysaccharide biosynthesis protein [Desulfobacteraceae bacterium]